MKRVLAVTLVCSGFLLINLVLFSLRSSDAVQIDLRTLRWERATTWEVLGIPICRTSTREQSLLSDALRQIGKVTRLRGKQPLGTGTWTPFRGRYHADIRGGIVLADLVQSRNLWLYVRKRGPDAMPLVDRVVKQALQPEVSASDLEREVENAWNQFRERRKNGTDTGSRRGAGARRVEPQIPE